MKLTPWTDITEDDTAQTKPDSAGLAMAKRDNAVHCQQILYDPDVHTAPTSGGHTHAEDNSANVGRVYPNMPNLIPNPYIAGKLSFSGEEPGTWTTHGVRSAGPGFGFGTAGQWASIVLGDTSRPSSSLSIFGGGTHAIMSIFARSNKAMTGGSIECGLSTGGAGTDDSERSFVPGARMEIPAGLLDVAWRRYWGVFDTTGMKFSRSIRMVVQCRDAPLPVGASVFANLVDLRVGQVLDYPVLGYGVGPSYLHTPVGSFEIGPGNTNWGGYGEGSAAGPPPPLDHAIAITDAIELETR